MTDHAMRLAGTAVRWRAVELAGVQAVYFLRLIVLAQLLVPDAFGLVAIAIAATAVMLRVSDLGMVPALVQRPSPSAAEYDGAWSVGLLRALTITLVLIAFASPIAGLFGEPAAAPIIQALALRPLIEALASIGMARLTREMRFGQLAMIALPAAATDLVVAVATAPWLGVWALVAGALSGATATLVLSYVLAPHRPRLLLSLDAVAPLMRYGGWVLAMAIVALMGSTSTQLAVSRLEGVATLGLYFLAARVAFLPIDAASTVIASVALPMFAKLREDVARTAVAFRTLLTAQAMVLLPGYAMMLVLAPELEAVLGERWHGTAPVMRILAVSAMTGLLGEMVTPLLMGRGRADRAFILEVVQSGVLLAVLLPLVLAFGAKGAALAWLSGNVAALVVVLIWLPALVPGGLRLEPAPLLAIVAAAVAAAAAAGWGATVLPGMTGLLAGAALGAGAVFLVLMMFDRWLDLELRALASWIRSGGTRGEANGRTG